MFTGIISNLGIIQQLSQQEGSLHLTINPQFALDDVAIGASIACNGVCLTVTQKTADTFDAVASGETLAITTLSGWQRGQSIHLERALKLGDELGGHMVSGHVDGTAIIISIEPVDVSYRMTFEAPAHLSRYIARKGSVAIDGISLTVNTVDQHRFSVNIIPHTWQHTTLKDRITGDLVNLEVDLLARYAERLMER